MFVSIYFERFICFDFPFIPFFLGRSQNLSAFPGYDSSVTGTSVLLSREKEDRTAIPFYRKSVSKIRFSEEKKSRKSCLILIENILEVCPNCRNSWWSILFDHTLWFSDIGPTPFQREKERDIRFLLIFCILMFF